MPGNDANTKLLLHCNGADTSTTFTDSSVAAPTHTVTANGDAQIDTAIKKWGTGSGLFDGTGDYLTTPDSTDWDVFGSLVDSQTVDLQIAFNPAAAPNNQILIGQYQAAGPQRWELIRNTNEDLAIIGSGGGADRIWSDTTVFFGNVADANWHHFAIIKVADRIGVYLDSLQVMYGFQNVTMAAAAPLEIGRRSNGTNYFAGNIDEVRVQADNYFLASPNSFPATPLLLYGEGADEATTMSNDGYSGAVTLTSGATNVTLQDTQKKFNATTSMYFDGTAYATVGGSSTDYDVMGATADSWTIDLWAKHTSFGVNEYYIEQYEASTDRWRINRGNSNVITFAMNSSVATDMSLATTTAITDTNWHHYAMVKTGTDFGIYLDGTQEGYVSYAETDAFTGGITLGRYTGLDSNYFDGYMEQVQITRENKFGVVPNVGLTSTITVPTGVLTQDTITEPTEEYAEVVAATGGSQAVIIA